MRRKFGSKKITKADDGTKTAEQSSPSFSTNNTDLSTGVANVPNGTSTGLWGDGVTGNQFLYNSASEQNFGNFSGMDMNGNSKFAWTPSFQSLSTKSSSAKSLADKSSKINAIETGEKKTNSVNDTQASMGQALLGGLNIATFAVKAYKPVETSTSYDMGMGLANSGADLVSSIPGLQGYAMAAKGALQVLDMSNSLFAKHVDALNEDKAVRARQNAGFGGVYATVDEAKSKSDKNYGWLSGGYGDAKKLRNEASRLLAGVAAVDKEGQDDLAAADDPLAQLRVKSKTLGQLTPYKVSAKNGTKFEYVDYSDGFAYKDYSEIVEFQKGGSFNIIPEGALHARKHNIDLDNVTKKGIPVVSESKDGELVQQAEIEHSEIIYRIEVTEKIEEFQKKYENSTSQSEKDQFAIEAGKLLVIETLHNTDDRVGLINKI